MLLIVFYKLHTFQAGDQQNILQMYLTEMLKFNASSSTDTRWLYKQTNESFVTSNVQQTHQQQLLQQQQLKQQQQLQQQQQQQHQQYENSLSSINEVLKNI